MKGKLTIIKIWAVLLMLVSCNHNKKSAGEPLTLADTVLYPYAPVYTSGFQTGKSSYSKIVLQIWKEFETGDVRHLGNYFADSMVMIFPDQYTSGKKELVLADFQKRRNIFLDVQCYVDAWIPEYVPDRKEDVVFIWGRQDGTTISGTRVYKNLHEIWRFDTFGKIKRMEQYITHPF